MEYLHCNACFVYPSVLPLGESSTIYGTNSIVWISPLPIACSCLHIACLDCLQKVNPNGRAPLSCPVCKSVDISVIMLQVRAVGLINRSERQATLDPQVERMLKWPGPALEELLEAVRFQHCIFHDHLFKPLPIANSQRHESDQRAQTESWPPVLLPQRFGFLCLLSVRIQANHGFHEGGK